MIVPKTQKVKIEASSNSMIGYIPIYDPDISKLANEMYEEDLYDLNYFDNYKMIASKDIDTLNKKEIQTYITYILRGERFCDGHMIKFIENGTLEKLTTRWNELDKGE